MYSEIRIVTVDPDPGNSIILSKGTWLLGNMGKGNC